MLPSFFFFFKSSSLQFLKQGPPADLHAVKEGRAGGHGEGISLLWLTFPLTFPGAPPSVGREPPTTVGPQPGIPRCSRPAQSWLSPGAARGGEGRVNGLLETIQTSPWKHSPPTCTVCVWIHPEPAVSSILWPWWEVGRHLGEVGMCQDGVTFTMGDHPSSGLSERSGDPGEPRAEKPYSGPGLHGPRMGQAKCGGRPHPLPQTVAWTLSRNPSPCAAPEAK